jgi:drug/metabolite transporter (DMT)-like permease
MQLAAMAVTIIGVLIVSFESDGENGYRFKLKAAALMFSASLCWALGDVVFKFVAIEENLQRALFWEHQILFAVGMTILFFTPKVRGQLRQAMTRNSRSILAINFTSEGLYILANVVSAVPLLMVQVAAVHLVQAFQPVGALLRVGLWTNLNPTRRCTFTPARSSQVAHF